MERAVCPRCRHANVGQQHGLEGGNMRVALDVAEAAAWPKSSAYSNGFSCTCAVYCCTGLIIRTRFVNAPSVDCHKLYSAVLCDQPCVTLESHSACNNIGATNVRYVQTVSLNSSESWMWYSPIWQNLSIDSNKRNLLHTNYFEGSPLG